MTVEFECPGCQQGLSGEITPPGLDVTCPGCGTVFRVEAPDLPRPTVKARAAAAAIASPVGRPPAGTSPRQPASSPAARKSPKSRGGKEMMLVTALGLAIAGGGFGIWSLMRKAEEKQTAAAGPSAREQARQRMAELTLRDAERREADHKERQQMIEKHRAEIAKRE